MQLDLRSTAVIILAAGRGTRMGGTSSKVLRPILGRSMINYTVRNLRQSGLTNFYVVTGHNYEDVQTVLGEHINFVHQHEQLGTAHAVRCALYEIPMSIKTVMVVNGDDSAFYDPNIITRILATHFSSHAELTVVGAQVKDPKGLGRIVRKHGELERIVEESDASKEERQIKEVNTGFYIFDIDWLRTNIESVKLSKSGEYYIVQLLEIAVRQHCKVNLQQLGQYETWYGVNTPQELAVATNMMQAKLTNENIPKLFVLDFDYTLYDTGRLKDEAITQGVSTYFAKNLQGQSVSQNLATFWRLYEEVKQREGWISFPDIIDKIAEEMHLSNIKIPLKRIIYSLPFHDYLYQSSLTTLQFLRRLGKVIILCEGDLVYNAAKIRGSGIVKSMDDVYLSTDKSKLYPEIISTFPGYELFLVDDQVLKLEAFMHTTPQATSFLIKRGLYIDQQPLDKDFQPTYQLSDLAEIVPILRAKY